MFMQFPSMDTILSTTLSAIVYTAVSTAGDATASAAKLGIELAGKLLGYGTDMVAGPIAGNTVRYISNSYSDITKHTIVKSTRIGAVSLSLVAGTGVILTTLAVSHGSNIITNYFNAHSVNTNKKPIKLHKQLYIKN